MTLKLSNLQIFIVLLMFFSGCTGYNKLLKSDNVDLKFSEAVKFFEIGNYPKSITLFDSVLPQLRGDKRAEKGTFLYAKSHFLMKRYIESASYFKTFLGRYSRSPYSEEAYFLATKSLYMQSSSPELDQTSTEAAYEASHTFLNKNKESQYVKEVEEMSEEAKRRLEKKSYDNAILYYDLKGYNPNMILSCIVTIENFEIDHPESSKLEELQYLKLKARYDLASVSTYEKKLNRFKKAEEEYLFFIENYPNSKYLKDAQNIYKKNQSKIEKIERQIK